MAVALRAPEPARSLVSSQVSERSGTHGTAPRALVLVLTVSHPPLPTLARRPPPQCARDPGQHGGKCAACASACGLLTSLCRSGVVAAHPLASGTPWHMRRRRWGWSSLRAWCRSARLREWLPQELRQCARRAHMRATAGRQTLRSTLASSPPCPRIFRSSHPAPTMGWAPMCRPCRPRSSAALGPIWRWSQSRHRRCARTLTPARSRAADSTAWQPARRKRRVVLDRNTELPSEVMKRRTRDATDVVRGNCRTTLPAQRSRPSVPGPPAQARSCAASRRAHHHCRDVCAAVLALGCAAQSLPPCARPLAAHAWRCRRRPRAVGTVCCRRCARAAALRARRSARARRPRPAGSGGGRCGARGSARRGAGGGGCGGGALWL